MPVLFRPDAARLPGGGVRSHPSAGDTFVASNEVRGQSSVNQKVASFAILGDDRPEWRPDRFGYERLSENSRGAAFPGRRSRQTAWEGRPTTCQRRLRPVFGQPLSCAARAQPWSGPRRWGAAEPGPTPRRSRIPHHVCLVRVPAWSDGYVALTVMATAGKPAPDQNDEAGLATSRATIDIYRLGR